MSHNTLFVCSLEVSCWSILKLQGQVLSKEYIPQYPKLSN